VAREGEAVSTEHTPTPYEIDAEGVHIIQKREDCFYVEVATTETPVSQATRAEQNATAIFIVRACNAHDELVAALVELVRLKDLHDACEDQTFWGAHAVSRETIDQLNSWELEYQIKKPLAWNAARAVLAKVKP
jgi:hypothetical protein